MRRKALLFAFLFAVASGAQETKTGNDSVLPVPASATSVERVYDGFWFSEGCHRIKYSVGTPYPGSVVLDFLLGDLRARNWTPVQQISRRFLPSPGVTKSLGRWEHWANADRGLTIMFMAGSRTSS
jgi:hypothetical protein